MSIVTTGVDMAHYAILKNDPFNSPGGQPIAPEYGEVIALSDLREVGVSSSDTFNTVFADNSPRLTAASKSEKSLSLIRFNFSNEEKQALLGWKISKDGTYFETAGSLPPYVALGFRVELSDGSYMYYWLLKGRIAINQTQAQTRESTVSPQFATAVGTFIARQADDAFQSVKAGNDGMAKEWFTVENLQKLLEAAEAGNGDGGSTPGNGNGELGGTSEASATIVPTTKVTATQGSANK
jgi:phi13 family phage major tail protein